MNRRHQLLRIAHLVLNAVFAFITAAGLSAALILTVMPS